MEHIMVLKGTDRARKRPLVFFESTGREGCNCAIGEILKYAIAETRSTTKKEIVLELYLDNSVKITNKGIGIPIHERNEEENKFNWEILFTDLYGIRKMKKSDNSKVHHLNDILNYLSHKQGDSHLPMQ